MLQAFAVERGAAGRAAEHEALGPRVGGGPDQVADPLEAEHRVVDEHRDHVHAVRRVGGAGGDERRHRAGFGDAFFEQLAVFRFLVERESDRNRPARRAGRRASRCRPGGTGLPCRTSAIRRARSARCACRSSCRAAGRRAGGRSPSSSTSPCRGLCSRAWPSSFRSRPAAALPSSPASIDRDGTGPPSASRRSRR